MAAPTRRPPWKTTTSLHLCGDLVGLIEALGEAQAVLVAHDWGAVVARDCVRLEPDRFSAVVNMSVPFGGPGPTSPIETMQRRYGDNFYYILYFQELDADGNGVADAEFDADPRGILSRLYLTGATRRPPEVSDPLRSAGGMIPRSGEPTNFPAWIDASELDYYVEEFTRAGFRGGINYYRNFHRNWELTRGLQGVPVSQPAMFIAGENDGVIGGATREVLTTRLRPGGDRPPRCPCAPRRRPLGSAAGAARGEPPPPRVPGGVALDQIVLSAPTNLGQRVGGRKSSRRWWPPGASCSRCC